MGMDYQLHRAWANVAKGIRQCQKADKAWQKGRTESVADHFGKAVYSFETAVEHLAKAADDADVKAGKLLSEGNQQLQKAIDQFADDDVDGAERHYEKALDKYDEALDLTG